MVNIKKIEETERSEVLEVERAQPLKEVQAEMRAMSREKKR